MTARPIPYPPKTDAKGWRFEIAYEQVDKSDTWALAKPEVRPWLLMLWVTAWKQVPCGSLPNSDELIAIRMGMSLKAFSKAKPVLLRGWWEAEDGRLYHDTIIERVNAMLEKRAKDAKRAADNRAKRKERPPEPPDITDVSRVTPDGPHGEFDTKHQAPSTSNSAPNGADGAGAPSRVDKSTKTPEEIAKAEVWKSAVLVLQAGGCDDETLCRTFMGQLVKDYTFPIVKEAVAKAVVNEPVSAREWLVATCKALKAEQADGSPPRPKPGLTPGTQGSTVPSPAETRRMLEEQDREWAATQKARADRKAAEAVAAAAGSSPKEQTA